LALVARRNASFRCSSRRGVRGGLGACAAATFLTSIVAMVGGLIVLFPGLTLTTAISELAAPPAVRNRAFDVGN
jgi:uncharacterized membrane protein YjjP (DUF1212 family)